MTNEVYNMDCLDLKRLNAENPYPSSKDPSTGDKIEPTADGLKF